MEKKPSWFAFSLAVARSLLQVRDTRRKLILYVIVVILAACFLGYWPLASWLEDSQLRFVGYWGACFFLTIFLMLLALYDFLTILKDYKDEKERL